MSTSNLKKTAYRAKTNFCLSRNYAMTASLKYLSVTKQEAVGKGKIEKFERKDI